MAVTFLSLLPVEAAAQWLPRIGIGYVTNLPEQNVGVSFHMLTMRWGGLGLYLDGKLASESRRGESNFDPQFTARQVEDQFGDAFIRDEDSFRSLNLALMRPITPELMLYAGVGYVTRETYVEYWDPELNRGRAGYYWVEDTDVAAVGLNGLAGGMFRIGRRLSLQLGLETAPRGATVGVNYGIPLGR